MKFILIIILYIPIFFSAIISLSIYFVAIFVWKLSKKAKLAQFSAIFLVVHATKCFPYSVADLMERYRNLIRILFPEYVPLGREFRFFSRIVLFPEMSPLRRYMNEVEYPYQYWKIRLETNKGFEAPYKLILGDFFHQYFQSLGKTTWWNWSVLVLFVSEDIFAYGQRIW